MTDAAKLPLMLTELRMPTFGRLWQEMGERADREGWGAARFLAALCEHELAERATRRIARHLAASGLPAERRSRPSTSRPPRRFAKPTSPHWPEATPGSSKAPTF